MNATHVAGGRSAAMMESNVETGQRVSRRDSRRRHAGLNRRVQGGVRARLHWFGKGGRGEGAGSGRRREDAERSDAQGTGRKGFLARMLQK